MVPEVTKAYREIRVFDKNVPIYFLYVNKGIVTNEPSDERNFFKKVFELDTLTDKNIYFIQDNFLYNQLNVKSLMTKWFYVYHKKLVAGATSIKLQGLSDLYYKLPKDFFTIGPPKKILIHPIGMRLNTERDIILPYKEGKLFYITDFHNNLFTFDISTGTFENTFDKKSFNPYLFYEKNISKSAENANLAYQDTIDNFMRDPLFIAGAVFQNDAIYLSTGVEVSVPWKDSYFSGLTFMTYVNEFGEKQKIKFDIIGETYPTLLKLDTLMNLIEAYTVDVTSYPKANRIGQSAGFWGGLDKGFFIQQDSSLIIDNNPDASVPLPKLPPQATHAFSVFKLKEKTFFFDRFLPSKYHINHPKYLDFHTRTNYFFFKNDLYGNLCTDENIYNLSARKPILYALKGLGNKPIKEIIPQYAEDTTQLRKNFRSLLIQPIFKDKYLIALYFYQDKLTMEILKKNKETGKLQAIQINELTDLEGLSVWEKDAYSLKNKDGICIQNDKIYLNSFFNGHHYLYEFPITLKD